MLPRLVYAFAWSFWIAWFVFWEFLAVVDPRKGDTLTEHLRPLIQSNVTGMVIAALFLVWLALHFLVDGRG